MAEPKEIVSHRSTAKEDANQKIRITPAGEKTPGGAPDVYHLGFAESPSSMVFVFQTAQRQGITNEALLAIVADRLEKFQAGPFACDENGKAIAALKTALDVLKVRTLRRVKEEAAAKVEEEKKAAATAAKAAEEKKAEAKAEEERKKAAAKLEEGKKVEGKKAEGKK